MPLIFAKENQILTILKILVDEKTRRHLENLGLVRNQQIELLTNANNIIIKVKETRLALNKELASKILVKEEE